MPGTSRLFAEIETYICYCDVAAERPENIAEAAEKVFHQRRVFHVLNRAYALALESSISIVKSERTFGHLKIVKIFLRSITKDERVNSLMLLYYEKYILVKIAQQQIVLNMGNEERCYKVFYIH